MINSGGTLLYDLKEVSREGLVQLTNWLPHIEEELEYLKKESIRITSDSERKAKIVLHKKEIALFVNPVGLYD